MGIAEKSRKRALERRQELDRKYGHLIKDWIDSGKSVTELSEIIGISPKMVKEFVKYKDENYIPLLRENGRKNCGTGNRKKSILGYQKVDEDLGETIQQMVEDGLHMAEIVRRLEFSSATFFNNYTKWKGGELRKKLIENGKRVNRENALKRSKLGAAKTRGIEQKPLTDAVKKKYIQMKNDGIHLAEIEREQKKLGFGAKKVEQLSKLYGKPIRKTYVGSDNPMHGISPSKKSGIGVKGWISKNGKRFFFRSSQEFRIFLYLLKNKIDFKICSHRINYKFEGKERTYCPDIVIENCIYEIKPKKMENVKSNRVKFEAAKEYCKTFNLEFGIINEFTYDIKFPNEKEIEEMIESGHLEIDKKNLEKYFRNMGNLKRYEKNYKNKRSTTVTQSRQESKS